MGPTIATILLLCFNVRHTENAYDLSKTNHTNKFCIGCINMYIPISKATNFKTTTKNSLAIWGKNSSVIVSHYKA